MPPPLARRFFLFDNGGRTADRYTLVDMEPVEWDFYGKLPERWYTILHFSNNPGHPQSVSGSMELSEREFLAFRRQKPPSVGRLITGDELPADTWRWLEALLKGAVGVTQEDIRRLYTGA